jgi:hypothetical protein
MIWFQTPSTPSTPSNIIVNSSNIIVNSSNIVVGLNQTICSQSRYSLIIEKEDNDNIRSQLISAIRPNVTNKRRNGSFYFEEIFNNKPEQTQQSNQSNNQQQVTNIQPLSKKLKSGKGGGGLTSSSGPTVSDSSGNIPSVGVPQSSPTLSAQNGNINQSNIKSQNLYWIGSINEEENKKLFDHSSHNNPCGFFVVCARPLFSSANSGFCMN